MEQENIFTGLTGATPVNVPKFAVGADHGGFELKELLKQHLQSRGMTFKDFGALTRDPADDYPDFAQPVAQAVAAGQAELGLLVCTSGVGIYIAANKIPGARAGQAFDEKEADLMRRHNDANVLCLPGDTGTEIGKKILDAFIAGKLEGGRHEPRVNHMDVRRSPTQL